MEISELSKLATECKKAGDFESAIRLMRQVESLMDRDEEAEFRAESYCRLPLCIHESGQLEDSIKQFKEVLKRFSYTWGTIKRNSVGNIDVSLAHQRAYVYDKIRLVLQREKRIIEAVSYSILSNTYVDRSQLEFFTLLKPKWHGKRKPRENWRDWMTYKEVQEFLEEPLESRAEYAIQAAEKLLKKTNASDAIEALKKYVYQLLQDINKSDDAVLLEVRLLLRGYPPV
jgi:tetratricopeptide (TPR) repeat protein